MVILPDTEYAMLVPGIPTPETKQNKIILYNSKNLKFKSTQIYSKIDAYIQIQNMPNSINTFSTLKQ